MSNDRELLELAAKAAGIHCKGWVMPGGRSDGWHGMYTGSDDDGAFLRWNPLTDDGDALRLMVRLRLEPRFIDNSHSNGAEPSRVTLHNFAGIVENIGDDPAATLRRAITRAAAEIGRQIK